MELSKVGKEFADLVRRRSTIGAVGIALVSGLAYVAASLFWTLSAGPSAAAFASALRGVEEFGAPDPAARLDILTRYDPFYPNAPQNNEAPLPAPPETTLDMKLFGTRLADDGNGGSAIVRLQNYNHTVLAVGDEVSPGVSLTEIHERHVVLSRNGHRETLYLDIERAHANQRDTEDYSVDAGPSISPESAIDAPAAPFLEGVILARKEDTEGSVTGYLVTIDDESERLSALDLQTGDVVVEVNGVPASDLGPLPRLRQSLQDATNITLLVERDGERRTVQLGSP